MHPPQIIKSNALIEASYRLTPAEQRIMLACIAQVRRDRPITDEVLYSVSAADIAKMTCSHSKTTYDELAKAALRLKRREVWLDERANGGGSHEETLVTGWVQSIRYRKHEGRVELRFTKDMLPYLTQLTEQFTRYALDDVAKMTSSHAIRLYELLAQWRGAGRREVEITWLREKFQLGDKYPAIKDFKRWVIEPAVKQINEHSPLWVKWEQRKTGRRVTHLTFIFGEKVSKSSQKTVRKKTNGNAHVQGKGGSGAIYGIPRSVIEANARVGESYEDAALRLLEESKHSAR
jgi:plasmid replication initiation protein